MNYFKTSLRGVFEEKVDVSVKIRDWKIVIISFFVLATLEAGKLYLYDNMSRL